MNLDAAASMLGVHYQTAYRWVRMGLLPAVRVGAGYELDRHDVETLAADRRRRVSSLMPTAVLSADRWRVHHLGCDIPTTDLVEFVCETLPELVVVSVTVAWEQAEEIRDKTAAAARVPVLVGGPGASLARLI